MVALPVQGILSNAKTVKTYLANLFKKPPLVFRDPKGDQEPLPRPVRNYIYDVICWDSLAAKTQTRDIGQQSNFQGIAQAISSGIVGTGNSGTKSVRSAGFTPEFERHVIEADPVAHARYMALVGDAFLTTRCVVTDGQGDQLIECEFGTRKKSLTLAQRVGLRMANSKQREKWYKRLASGDSDSALFGANLLGETMLFEATKAWFSVAL